MNHSETNDLLQRLSSTLGAPECHGLMCGLLSCMPTTRAKARWYAELIDSTGLSPEDLPQYATDLKTLEVWFDSTVTDYHDAEFTLQLLLPDEDEPIAARVQGLAHWCSGFCAGVGLGTGWSSSTASHGDRDCPVVAPDYASGASDASLPEDTRELLGDFVAITQAAAAGNDEADETDESTLMELEEYVRVGALLIGEEMQPPSATTSSQLH